MADLLMPPALRVVNEWLKTEPRVTDHVGTRISPKLGGSFPAIRLTDLGPIERGPEEALRRIQVECWAADHDTADAIARAVESVVPDAGGTWPSGHCAGGTVVSGPFSNPDPNSERHRFQLDLALWLYPIAD